MEQKELEPYECAICFNTYIRGRSDKIAMAEHKARSDVPIENCVIVCDDCFKVYMEFVKHKGMKL